MADPTPLLPHYSSSAFQSDRAKMLALLSIDDTIESCIGATGVAQLLQAFLVSMALVFDAQQTFINVFTDAEPSWHCTHIGDPSCSSAIHPCGLPKGSWAWNQPKHTSIISEWNLECSAPAVVGIPASAYFAGCLAGGLLLATLADSWLGRKNMLFLSSLTMSLTAALAAVSPNMWAYSALRFICGFARATIGTSALVLSTEIVGKRWRDRVSNISYFCFTLGFLSLPAIAYLGRGSSWRNLYLWTSIPSFLYSISAYFLIRESPRWLLVRGRRDEAINTLKSIAASNGNIIDSSFSDLSVVEETWNVDLYSAMKILWEKRWAFRRLEAVMMVSFGVGMMYYGMPLNVGNLNSNLYISVTVNALAELPSSLITFFLIGRLDRRSSAVMFTTISGVCSILCVFLRTNGWQMAVEVMSFFSACTALNVLMIHSIELFPTSVRNSALSMVRQALVLGGVFAPMLVAAGRKKSFWSFGMFGLVTGGCGLFAAYLPETRGRGISDTMEEEECKTFVSSNLNP